LVKLVQPAAIAHQSMPVLRKHLDLKPESRRIAPAAFSVNGTRALECTLKLQDGFGVKQISEGDVLVGICIEQIDRPTALCRRCYAQLPVGVIWQANRIIGPIFAPGMGALAANSLYQYGEPPSPNSGE
jgi:hypothetical protein